MNCQKCWLWIGILLFSAAVAACAPLYPTPKKITRGTATATPFQPQATFTRTPQSPPTVVRASSLGAAPPPSSTVTKTPSGSETPSAITPSTTVTSSPSPSSPTPSLTPSFTFTVAPTNTPDAEDPTISVTVTTNCRTGPGVNYPRVGSLYPEQTATLIGRHAYLNYWVIELPGSGATCWLWGYYANPSGNYGDLPASTPPPSPTVLPTHTFSPTPTTDPAKITPTEKPAPTSTFTPTPIPDTPTPGSPPPPTPTSPPTDTPAPTNSPVPTSTPTPGSSKYCSYTSVLSGHEQQIKTMINDARADHGLPPLKTNWNLKVAARDHGRDMTCNNMSGHTSSDGTEAWVRIARALGHGDNWCYNNWACTEIWSGHGSPESAFYWWMNHESQDPNYDDNIHKRMILHERMTHLGVGAIYYNDGSRTRIYYTVDFARP